MAKCFIYSTLLFFGAVSCVSSQLVAQRGQPAATIRPETATIDRFGNVFYANTDHQVHKHNALNQPDGLYSNHRLGVLASIDVTNPLKILLYYPDFYTVILLDRLLHETNSFNMLDLGYGEIRAVASSLDGQIWIFDDHAQRLNKVSQLGQVLLEGEDLRLRFNERLRPTKIMQAGDRVYVLVPDRGVLVFDLFGQWQSQILREDITDMQIVGGRLVYRYGDQLELYHPSSLETQVITVADVGPETKILLYREEMILVQKNGVERKALADF